MNICFVMEEKYEHLQADLLAFAAENNIAGIKGHRSVGGFRASCYNALEKESVEALVAVLKEFEAKNK